MPSVSEPSALMLHTLLGGPPKPIRNAPAPRTVPLSISECRNGN